NVALTSADLHRTRMPAVVTSFLPRFDLGQSDQLRALICDGPTLLAWVGGLRARAFGAAEQRLIASIVPALQRRLSLEHRLAEVRRRAVEIGGALESVPAAAFIIGRNGGVLHANAAGRAMFERDRAGVALELCAATRRQLPGASVARLSADSDLRLAILPHAADPVPLVAAARARWQLTPRQTEVLRLVATGLSNRAVAAELQCAESTV